VLGGLVNVLSIIVCLVGFCGGVVF
jgi:hypothetical protein